MSSIFGWSLPPGCKTLPGEENVGPIASKCPNCGEFLQDEPSRFEYPPFNEFNNDAILFYDCPNCGEVDRLIGVFCDGDDGDLILAACAFAGYSESEIESIKSELSEATQ